MTNVWVMYGPYSKEKNHYLFGYTYIPKETPEDKMREQKKTVSERPKRKIQCGNLTVEY